MAMAERSGGYLHGPMAEAAARLRARYREIQRKHRGEQGRARELAVASELLRRFLPKKLGVGSGEVVATDGSTSAQHDILIYDALETPVFDDANGSVVVPIEGVYAAVEVASRLDPAKLREDAAKIARLKEMPKSAYFHGKKVIEQTFTLYGGSHVRFPILGFCFAYTGSPLESLWHELMSLDAERPLEKRLDMLCVLDQGCIANATVMTTEAGHQQYGQYSGVPGPTTDRVPVGAIRMPSRAKSCFSSIYSRLVPSFRLIRSHCG